MENEIDTLLRRLVLLENEVEQKWAEQRTNFQYRLERNRAVFEDAVLREHRLIKQGLIGFLRSSPLASIVVAPAVYSMVLPIFLLDIATSFYQAVCFSAWGIQRVRRRDHVIIDRHRLAYLNGIEKLNCAYCGYANGVIAYVSETASRTEQYWCPIKHALRVKHPHKRYRRFLDYGDAEGYRARLEEIRSEVRRDRTPESE